MAKNRFPIIIPCHRVVASNSLGGFTARDGVNLKQRMLELEGIATQTPLHRPEHLSRRPQFLKSRSLNARKP
jgi:hypothetical protein